ncbi:MAG: hypothetical protein K940chlam9_00780 [Chlamydiae bacterium]|nr:hypothetical protein [Chlamydiota bacterium]
MKNKSVIFGAILTTCIMALGAQAKASHTQHSDMPRGGYQCFEDGTCSERQNSNHNGNGSMNRPLKMHSVEKMEGTVKSVNRMKMPKGDHIEVVLDTENGEKHVILGSARKMEGSKVRVQAGDKIQVVGFPVKANGKEVMMAREVSKNGNVHQILDDRRQPVGEDEHSNNGNAHRKNGHDRNGNSRNGNGSHRYN